MRQITFFMMAMTFAGFVQAEFNAAVIDMQKAITSSNSGQKAKKDLEAEFEKKKNEFKKKEDDFKKKVEEFEKKKMVYSDQVRQEKGMELQQEMMKLREEMGKSQMQMQQRQAEMTKPILEKVQKIVSEIAKEKGYSAVFERAEQMVLWSKSELDITDEVIKKINK